MAIIILEKTKVDISKGIEKEGEIITTGIAEKEGKYIRAVELVSPQGYFNTDSNITIQEFVGNKIILIDFWTYSCINCQRTLPYLNAWYERYEDEGLVIIGIHTPEFEFEKDYNNVKKAIDKYDIKYPIVQDNNYATWRAYKNNYWPRKYLIDIDGYVVYDHIGEGNYKETEIKIKELLKERNERLNATNQIGVDLTSPKVNNTNFNKIATPEIYFGYEFSRNQIGNSEGWIKDKVINYEIDEKMKDNQFYLNGSWKNNPDNMELVSDTGDISIVYSAKEINLVAGAEAPVNLNISIDGKKVKTLIIRDYGLYNLFTDSYTKHKISITAEKGLKAYTFTFG